MGDRDDLSHTSTISMMSLAIFTKVCNLAWKLPHKKSFSGDAPDGARSAFYKDIDDEQTVPNTK